MRRVSEFGGVSGKVIFLMCFFCAMIAGGIYLYKQYCDSTDADTIINAVWEVSNQAKKRFEDEAVAEEMAEEEGDLSGVDAVTEGEHIERGGYAFAVLRDSSLSMVKVDAERTTISLGVCKALKAKFIKGKWSSVLEKVVLVDRVGTEKTNVLQYDCPDEDIPKLRFYVKFAPPKEAEPAPEAEEPRPVSQPSRVAASSVPSRPSPSPVKSSSYSQQTCPVGTSASGRGGVAIAGCRCNNSGENWDGRSCKADVCPAGSSRNVSKGDRTNVAGCWCNAETPVWTGGRCTKNCTGNKVWDDRRAACVCPEGLKIKTGWTDVCVECNDTSDCFVGFQCVGNKCINNENAQDDCRWGVCQTCDENKVRSNVFDDQVCETAGLTGLCNGNGTCYPTEGRRCASIDGCPAGQFCNYGGSYNASKKQKGRFGQTPNVCQLVVPQEFKHKNVTYYYNSKEDLKSWCRAANNKANCLWGYLAKSGAESWCASLGKRLLTRAEMEKVWSVLQKELPQTYRGYAYWVQEGAWIVDTNGGRSFGKGHPDGYGGKGGVVCR